jgi:hypothetical protein
LYGCEIWGFGNNDILEKVHLKFCKIILHLKATTPNCMMYGELDINQIKIKQTRFSRSYTLKISKGIISYKYSEKKNIYIHKSPRVKFENDLSIQWHVGLERLKF